jgi:hypothetical protein
MTTCIQKPELPTSVQNGNDVEELRNLLGPSALLISWPLGSKGDASRRWARLTNEIMKDPRHLQKLRSGNIGVVLGHKSAHLINVDIDRDDQVDPFVKCNPWIANTLQTHGSRGRVFWSQMEGDYPEQVLKIRDEDGNHIGEWRGAHQSIICGVHPEGHRYTYVVRAQPMVVNYATIQWPKGWHVENYRFRPPQASSGLLRPLRATPGHSGAIDKEQLILDAVMRTAATGTHQNHRLLFDLARGVKGVVVEAELRRVFDMWWDRSKKFARNGYTSDDYFFEFCEAFKNVKFGFGQGSIDQAFDAAKETELPPEADQFQSAEVKLLVGLCWQLQRLAGDGPLFLSCRTVARLFQLGDDHKRALRWLQHLVRVGILKIQERGSMRQGGRATRYRWTGVRRDRPEIPDSGEVVTL